jgi:type VI protein secretion system component Hcp
MLQQASIVLDILLTVKKNSMRKIIQLFFAAALIFTCSNAFSQTSVVMKAMNGTIKLVGGSTVAGHVGEIDLLSYSQGESTCASCVGAPTVQDLSVMLSITNGTMGLKRLLLTKTKLTSVDLYYIKGGTTPVTYYRVHMENVTVESVQESGSNEAPTFSASFFPDRIAWQYTNDAGVKSTYGWDVTLNVFWSFTAF